MYIRLSKVSHTLILCCLLICILILSACSGNTTDTPTAQQLISKSQTAIQKVTSYHFNLVADNPGAGGLIVIKSADGDIIVPDKLKADANAIVIGNVVPIKMIAIGDKQFVTDPLTGKWSATTALLDPRTLADPQQGVAAILGHIQNPDTPTESNVDGTPCWNINGMLDTQYLRGIIGSAPTGKQVKVTTCIGKADNLPYLIRVNGIAVQGDTDKTVRTFKLSKFGETITIDPPIQQ